MGTDSSFTKILRLILVLAILLSSVFIGYLLMPKKPVEIMARPPMQVQTVKAKLGDMLEVYTTTAVVKSAQMIDITSPTGGIVKNLAIKSGTKVTSGEVLVSLTPDFNIKAPISGVLTDWQISEGSHLSVGQKLVTIVNQHNLEVHYYVPAMYAEQLKLGQELTIKSSVSTNYAQVTYVSPVIDPQNYSILVHAKLDNTAKLKPGTFVELAQEVGQHKNTVILPEAALIPTISGYDVYEVQNNKLVRQKVELGPTGNDEVVIVNGVKAGAEVIVVHPPGLYPGAEVVTHEWVQ